jgi:hypothetical protein
MEWNNSGIGPAIQKAKSLKALFVVVIHGDDENSNLFLDLMNDTEVTSLLSPDNCVALKLKHESEGYKQFNDLYPVILVPSVYFIDSSNGVDVEVTGGLQVTKDRLIQSIKKAFASAKIVPAESAPNAENVLSPRAVRVEQARDVIKQTWDTIKESAENKNSSTSNADDQENPSSSNANLGTISLEERVSRAKELLAARRGTEQKEIEDKEKNSEKERRDMGKKVHEIKKTQEEKDALEAAKERKKDREETKLARERVKAQIEQDRLEKQAKFDVKKQQDQAERKQKEKATLEEQSEQAEKLAAARSTLARVQFRLPEGGTRINAFAADAPLSDVYKYVNEELSDSVAFRSGFSLFITFPRSLLDEKPMDSPLRELGLAPSGTILVLPKNRSLVRSGGTGASIMDYVWLLLTPLTVLWGLLSSFVTPTTVQTNSTPTAGPSQANQARNQRNLNKNHTGVRSDGNVARLRNLSDDDDETNTWNGNSTQQQ